MRASDSVGTVYDAVCAGRLDTLHNFPMEGVGTELGTLAQFWFWFMYPFPISVIWQMASSPSQQWFFANINGN